MDASGQLDLEWNVRRASPVDVETGEEVRAAGDVAAQRRRNRVTDRRGGHDGAAVRERSTRGWRSGAPGQGRGALAVSTGVDTRRWRLRRSSGVEDRRTAGRALGTGLPLKRVSVRARDA